jgi:hypothetical protein
MRLTPNPNKCTHNLRGRAISTKIEIISTTRGGTSQNSTDFDSGRRPKLKSEEFCEVPPLVVEIRCGRQFVTFPQKMYTYWDFGSFLPFAVGIHVGHGQCWTFTGYTISGNLSNTHQKNLKWVTCGKSHYPKAQGSYATFAALAATRSAIHTRITY